MPLFHSRSRPTAALYSTVLATALLLQAGSAAAWNISVGTGNLGDAFSIDSSSGSYTWTTLQAGVQADEGTSSNIPINWTFQSWDGTEWPSIELHDVDPAFPPATEAHVYYDDVADEYWSSAEAFVYGSVAVGKGVSAGWAYDFELVLDPFSSVEVLLDPNYASVYLESDLPGDTGDAFGQIKLYSTDLDVNDNGGANHPWAGTFQWLPAQGATIDDPAGFSHLFDNPTGSSVTYTLRLEGSSLVFAVVPEPGTLTLLGAGVLCMAVRRRR